jgi:hypothetical protein
MPENSPRNQKISYHGKAAYMTADNLDETLRATHLDPNIHDTLKPRRVDEVSLLCENARLSLAKTKEISCSIA